MFKTSDSTLFLGKNIVFVPECASTSTLLAEISQKTALAEGTVVITHHQTAGRGQRGNRWEALPGLNLTFSILLKPSLNATDQFLLTKMTSLALLDYLRSKTGSPVMIKWPNDMLLENRKVCGILIENTIAGSMVQQCIVGIGLNINQKSFSTPTATSLSAVARQDYDLNTELHLLLHHLEVRYLQLRRNEYHTLRADYLSNLIGKDIVRTFRDKDGTFQGEISGVDDSGRLIVMRNNHPQLFGMKEIEFVF